MKSNVVYLPPPVSQRMRIPFALKMLGKISHAMPTLGGWLAFQLSQRPRRKMRKASHDSLPAGDGGQTISGLHFRKWGKSGPLVICLHGWEGSASQFTGLANHLADNGFRVVALDASAHGTSPGNTTNPLEFLSDLIELQQGLNEPAHLIGHSMGGAVAMLAVRDGMPCRQLVAIAAPINFSDAFVRFNREIGLSAAAYDYLVAAVEKRIKRSLDSVDLLRRPPRRAMLLIHDKADKEVAFARAQLLAGVSRDCELYSTNGLGHQRILKSPEVWDRIVRQLKSAGAS